jgi:hypothetical protein
MLTVLKVEVSVISKVIDNTYRDLDHLGYITKIEFNVLLYIAFSLVTLSTSNDWVSLSHEINQRLDLKKLKQ